MITEQQPNKKISKKLIEQLPHYYKKYSHMTRNQTLSHMLLVTFFLATPCINSMQQHLSAADQFLQHTATLPVSTATQKI